MKLYCVEPDCKYNKEGLCQRDELQVRYDNTIPTIIIETVDYEQCYERKENKQDI